MTRMITKPFDSFAEAERAAQDLRVFGIPESDIGIVASAPGDIRDRPHGLGDGDIMAGDPNIRTIEPVGEPPHDVARGAQRGALLSVRVDDDWVNEVESILCAPDTVDVTDRRSAYRAEGWSAFAERTAVSGREIEAERVGDRRIG